MSEQATPTGVRMIAVTPEGEERNITEGVQVLYDLVIQSMDWGSGFLSIEDVEPVVALAKFCGFKKFEEAESYLATELKREKQRNCEHPSTHLEPHPFVRGYAFQVCDECEGRWIQ